MTRPGIGAGSGGGRTKARDSRCTDSCHRRDGVCSGCMAAVPAAARTGSLWLLTVPGMSNPDQGPVRSEPGIQGRALLLLLR